MVFRKPKGFTDSDMVPWLLTATIIVSMELRKCFDYCVWMCTTTTATDAEEFCSLCRLQFTPQGHPLGSSFVPLVADRQLKSIDPYATLRASKTPIQSLRFDPLPPGFQFTRHEITTYLASQEVNLGVLALSFSVPTQS